VARQEAEGQAARQANIPPEVLQYIASLPAGAAGQQFLADLHSQVHGAPQAVPPSAAPPGEQNNLPATGPSGSSEDDENSLDESADGEAGLGMEEESSQAGESDTESETDEDDDQEPRGTEDIVEKIKDAIESSDTRHLYAFDCADYLQKSKKNVEKNIRSNPKRIKAEDTQPMCCYGATQSGKTGYKAVMAMLGKQMGFATVVITTTVDNRNKMAADLKKYYFDPLPEDCRPMCLTLAKTEADWTNQQHQDQLCMCVRQGGVIVLNNSAAAINKVRNLISMVRGSSRHVHFVCIKDEADTHDRTPLDDANKRLKMEQAEDLLFGKARINSNSRFGAPLMISDVSATLLSVFFRIRNDQRENVEMIETNPSDEYCGHEHLEPFNNMFLAEKELRPKNAVCPFWSDTVKELYDDAHPADARQQKKGVLLLDAVNSRVTVEGNIYERGKYIVRKYPRFVTVVVAGGGKVSLYLPDKGKWIRDSELHDWVHKNNPTYSDADVGRKRRRSSPKLKIVEILNEILRTYGQGRPIAVIGYTRLLRGESFRTGVIDIDGQTLSTVPTHMLVGLAATRSFDDLVQMAGRATGNFKTWLDQNMGEGYKIKVLMSWKDWDFMVAYINFQRELMDRLKAGESPKDALDGLSGKYSYKSQPLTFQQRSIGPKKLKNQLNVESFEPAPEQHNMLGHKWAEQRGFPSFDNQGLSWRLDSPIQADKRSQMTEFDKVLEEFLYHSRRHKDQLAVLLRKVLMRSEDAWALEEEHLQDVHFSETDMRGLCSELNVLATRRGELYCKTSSKRWSQEKACHLGGTSMGCWRFSAQWEAPFFQKVYLAEGDQGCLGEHDDEAMPHFKLNPEIIKFAHRHREAITRQPPLFTKQDIEGYIQDP
jgi:hypothetical protein